MSWTFLIGLLIIFAVPGAWLCLVFLCGVVLDWNDRLDEQDQRDAPDPQNPLMSALGLSQSKSGLTSAPRAPHAEQMNLGSRSDSRTSSDHRSRLILIE